VIVELGVYEGVSTRILSTAMDDDAELYGVDPFPTGKLLFSPQMTISKIEIRKSRKGGVRLLRQNSAQAAESWTKPIDLLFMDGDHSFEGACRDFREWTRFISQGGLIAIHTTRSSPTKPVPDGCGMVRLVKEVVANDPGFRIDYQVDSITVVVKL
jgi:predicted O-methyltransferase YrrM